MRSWREVRADAGLNEARIYDIKLELERRISLLRRCPTCEDHLCQRCITNNQCRQCGDILE